MTRSFPGFGAAADECAISSVYGGDHWPSGNIHGQSLGYFVAQHVLADFLTPLATARFAGIVRADQQSQLSIEGQSNGTYVIEASADLKHWQSISTNLVSNGVIQFTDTSATNAIRFYRAIAR